MVQYRKIMMGGALALQLLSAGVFAAEIKVAKVSANLSAPDLGSKVWKGVAEEPISLMAQPIALPRPSTTTTSMIRVQAIHDGKWIAFRMKWKAASKNEAGRLGQFSDAVALQFPVKAGSPPPIFMGEKGNPVHIFHWRAQYQRDLEKGKPTMKQLYPNMNPDMYPMEFKDSGSVEGLTDAKREVYAPGQASGNPQSYVKGSAVDEILAEGFGSSAVIENRMSIGKGEWSNGEWSVVIARPLVRESGSVLEPGKLGHVAFAVWQGGQQEVGARKCVTMTWVPVQWVAQ